VNISQFAMRDAQSQFSQIKSGAVGSAAVSYLFVYF